MKTRTRDKKTSQATPATVTDVYVVRIPLSIYSPGVEPPMDASEFITHGERPGKRAAQAKPDRKSDQS